MIKLFTTILIAAFAFFIPVANAQVVTCTGSDEYIMSEFETIDIAKQRAKQKAERAAQEQAGVFVESSVDVVNMMVTKDEIHTMTAGILHVKDVQYQLTPLADGKSLIVKATVTADVDTTDITNWLNRPAGERSDLVAQNLELQKAIAAQDAQIAELKRQLANKPQDSAVVTEKFAEEDKIFLSNQKLAEVSKLYYQGDLNGAAQLCTRAIELNLENASAYSIRGAIYYRLNDFNGALADFNKAIILNPADYRTYYNRGLAYVKLNNYQMAAQDFNKALELNPNDEDSRYNRDLCYKAMKRY